MLTRVGLQEARLAAREVPLRASDVGVPENSITRKQADAESSASLIFTERWRKKACAGKETLSPWCISKFYESLIVLLPMNYLLTVMGESFLPWELASKTITAHAI